MAKGNWGTALALYGCLLEGLSEDPLVDDAEDDDDPAETARLGYRRTRPLRLLDGEVASPYLWRLFGWHEPPRPAVPWAQKAVGCPCRAA